MQCDVCEKAHATVLCCADEASLCADCDTRVHAANKLASKHQRVPLLYPSPQDLPCCDICQEKTGYFFCFEDRALLCRNCDYSIHSTNALAANHKRFLVSGIRVALQVISANDTSERTDMCSPSQMSCPTTQVSSPTTQVTQLSSARSVHTQRTARMPSSSIKSTCVVPQENSSLFANVIREESLTKVPSLSVPKQEQQQSQHVTPTAPRLLGHVTPTGVLPSKVIGASTTTSSPSSISQQSHFSAGRHLSDWDMHTNINMNSHDVSKGEMLTSQRGGGGGGMRRNSISEYLTDAIPGWRVDDLLNLPDMDTIYNFADPGASKADASLIRDECWPVECDVQELGETVVAEVPSIPSPPTASGVPRSTKPWGFGKSLKEPDLDFFLHCDDTLVVPDIGGVSSPTSLFPSSLPQKRRRAFSEF